MNSGQIIVGRLSPVNTRGQSSIVSATVYVRDMTVAPSASTLAPYNFVTTGTYIAPTTLDDINKGCFMLFAYEQGMPMGSNVDLNVVQLDGSIAPMNASNGIPMILETASQTEPWLTHIGPTRQSNLHFKLVFAKTGLIGQIVYEWDEVWN